MELPDFDAIDDKRQRNEDMTALEIFILENEPAGQFPEKMFRDQLLNALEEVVSSAVENVRSERDLLADELSNAKALRMDTLAKLSQLAPQTYGEAIVQYPWIACEPHEWDNRSLFENLSWLLGHAR